MKYLLVIILLCGCDCDTSTGGGRFIHHYEKLCVDGVSYLSASGNSHVLTVQVDRNGKPVACETKKASINEAGVR